MARVHAAMIILFCCQLAAMRTRLYDLIGDAAKAAADRAKYDELTADP